MDRIAALQPTAVNAILAEVRQLQAEGRQLVSLMRGEPDLPTPPHIVEACTRALRNGRTGYPDNRGEKSFREAVARKLERDNHLSYDPGTESLATSGATFGIYAALQARLTRLDAELRVLLLPVRGGVLLTYHASWGYFTDAYGLRQLVIEAEGRAPAARQLAALIDQASQAQVRKVFTEPPYDPRPSQTVANQIHAEVAVIDPLAESPSVMKIVDSYFRSS